MDWAVNRIMVVMPDKLRYNLIYNERLNRKLVRINFEFLSENNTKTTQDAQAPHQERP